MTHDEMHDDAEGRIIGPEEIIERESGDSKADDGEGLDGSGTELTEISRLDGPDGKGSAIPSLSVTVETEAEEQQAPALMYPVVGFGASAGGLQAFREVLENLNPQTGCRLCW